MVPQKTGPRDKSFKNWAQDILSIATLKHEMNDGSQKTGPRDHSLKKQHLYGAFTSGPHYEWSQRLCF